MVRSLRTTEVLSFFGLFSQNMGGCAVQNTAALCYCPNLYYGYYCQNRQ